MNAEISIDRFKKTKKIKKGSFGCVYEVEEKETGLLYAAKVVDCEDDETKCEQIISREVKIIICVQHPTIIKFYGYSKLDFHNEHNVTIIMELAVNGSLSDIINSIIRNNGPPNYTNTTRQIILFGISYGMKHLHEHDIIHRDLKAENILIDSELHPHITDFGLSKFLDIGNSFNQSKSCGTLCYNAPEVLENKNYNRKADVYSFGILMYEIITDSFAFPELQKGEMTIFEFRNKIVNENHRPNLENGIKDKQRELIEQCLSSDPSKRPSFDEISKKLSEFHSQEYFLDDVDIDEFEIYYEDVVNFVEPPEGLLHRIENLKLENEKLKKDNNDQHEQISILKSENDKLELINRQNQNAIASYNSEKEEQAKLIHDLDKEMEEIKKENILLKKRNEKLEKKIFRMTKDNETSIRANSTLKEKKSQSFVIDDDIRRHKRDISPLITDVKKRKEKSLIDKVDSLSSTFEEEVDQPNANKMTIQEFNDLPLISKGAISNNLSQSSDTANSSFFQKMDKLIQFLMNILDQSKPCIEIIQSNDEYISKISGNKSIKLLFYSTEKLIQTKIITSHNLLIILNEFSRVNIEIKYPSDSFKKSYDLAFRIKRTQKNIKKFEISIHIFGFQKDDKIFYGNININSVTLDNSLTTIPEYSFQKFLSLQKIIIPQSVISIGNFAFSECTMLKNISISSKVTSIGIGAFDRCSLLTQIKIPSSVTVIESNAFNKCSRLIQIIIPQSVRSIGSNAFDGCTSLKQITIPPFLTSIQKETFHNCSQIVEIIITSSIRNIEDGAFSGCTSLKQITIPPSVISIDKNAFNKCSALTQITIPQSVRSIGSNAFDGCTSLKKITIPPNLTSIQKETFHNCSQIVEIKIPFSILNIKNGAFRGCSSLTQITIPSSVTSIGDYAFSECTSLTQIQILSSVKSIGDYAFSKCSKIFLIQIPYVKKIGIGAFSKCTSLKKVIISSLLTSIQKGTFSDCPKLKNIDIPSSVKTIEDDAFNGCSSLTQITIPSSVTSIGGNAFSGCSSLTQITIPPSVTSIGSNAFNGCSLLTQITIPPSVTSIGSNAFCGCSSLTQISIPSTLKIDNSILGLNSNALIHFFNSNK